MKKAILLMVLAASLLLSALPSAAMMGDGHGHGDSGQSSRDPRDQPPRREPEARPSGHRHGDYYHDHDGGQLPHSHEETRPAQQEAPKSEVTPAPAKKKSVTAKPAGKVLKKTTKQSEPGHDPSRESAGFHRTEEPSADRQPAATPPSAAQPSSAPPAATPATPASPVKALMPSNDEVVMRLVRGSMAGAAKDVGDKERGSENVGDFYMDETHVTNHQYAEFLNKVLPSIKVENGIVWGNGEIWLLLGEVIEGYEPIVFHDGRFRVKGAHHAACAVLRVTAFGALAYARFYGESLPTEEQWIYALSAGGTGPALAQEGVSSSSAEIPGPGEAQGHGIGPPEAGTSLPIPSPVMLYPANGLGIRGLNGSIGEWGIRAVNDPSKTGQEQLEYVVLGGGSGQPVQGVPGRRAIRRYPWEAFSEVGFRCVRALQGAATSVQLPGARGGEPKASLE